MPYKDPEISRAYHAAYRALHREKAVIYSRAYRRGIRAQRPPKQTQEERLVKHRIYNNAHHEEILAYAKEYTTTHQEYRKNYWNAHREEKRLKDKIYASTHRE